MLAGFLAKGAVPSHGNNIFGQSEENDRAARAVFHHGKCASPEPASQSREPVAQYQLEARELGALARLRFKGTVGA